MRFHKFEKLILFYIQASSTQVFWRLTPHKLFLEAETEGARCPPKSRQLLTSRTERNTIFKNSAKTTSNMSTSDLSCETHLTRFV